MFAIDALILPLALCIDRIMGDPKTRFHPVALLGSFIGWWGRTEEWHPAIQRGAGVVMWFFTVTIFAIPFFLAEHYLPGVLLLIVGAVLLKSCLAWRSLEEHARSVGEALSRDLGEARREAALMVSRETNQLSDEQVLSAAYESLSENLVDSIISPIFYFGLFGLAGAAVFRAANTMDAMLGYRDERERIGWFSARMDDLLNFIPARIAGVLLLMYFGIRGRFSPAYEAYRRDRRKRPGFNGGIPMAILAGGAGVQFEKPGKYLMGTPERSLKEGGPEIISAVRAVTITFTLVIMMALIILGSMTKYTGI